MAIITLASIKGGVGKSTLAIHIASALQAQGLDAGVVDADLDQQSTARFLERRRKALNGSAGAVLETAHVKHGVGSLGRIRFDSALRHANRHDHVIIDLPGSNSELLEPALLKSHVLLTPINESFIDLDVIGSETGEPGPLATVVQKVREARASSAQRPLRWIVVRNRLSPLYTRNAEAVDTRLKLLAKQFDFEIGPGLTERVVFRELYDRGLTLLDAMTSETVKPSMSTVAARSELRSLMVSLALPSQF